MVDTSTEEVELAAAHYRRRALDDAGMGMPIKSHLNVAELLKALVAERDEMQAALLRIRDDLLPQGKLRGYDWVVAQSGVVANKALNKKGL